MPVIVLTGLALVAAQLGVAPTASAAETCTDTPVPGYTVRVCLVSPDSEELAEIKSLKSKVRRLEEDNAILKAATVFFVGELDPRNR